MLYNYFTNHQVVCVIKAVVNANMRPLLFKP
jgi:hypothetical protein